MEWFLKKTIRERDLEGNVADPMKGEWLLGWENHNYFEQILVFIP